MLILRLNCSFLLFLHCRQGIQQRRSSWQDGVYGTNCPIPPGGNFTYNMQFKDQIGTYYYFPSLLFHKAAGGYGGIRVLSRPRIPVPFDPPAGDFTILAGDWFKLNHTVCYHPQVSCIASYRPFWCTANTATTNPRRT